ncbi:hypothetical protein BDZ91DRAFT_736280 [Kalaharituber pfeilii]|nr:hypothetical protein BDZ91DRAFT_736280 [Kalaharituber pfeilii]
MRCAVPLPGCLEIWSMYTIKQDLSIVGTLLKSFGAHTPNAQKLLIDNIKADLRAKINLEVRRLNEEPQALLVDTSEAYEAELRAELQLTRAKNHYALSDLANSDLANSDVSRQSMDLEGPLTYASSSLASTQILPDSDDSLTDVDSPDVQDTQEL